MKQFCWIGFTLVSMPCAIQPLMAQKPNIVLILVDDMGWKDAGYSGSSYYHTPYINRLAKEGTIFWNAYSSSPVSSPSRGAILTGLNAAATQFTCVFGPESEVPGGDSLFPVTRHADSGTNQNNEAYSRHALPRTSKLLVETMQENGYTTALFGKWHCGVGDGFYPSQRGFNEAVGYRKKHIGTKGHHIYSFEGNLVGLEKYDSTRYLSEVLTEECIGFIKRNQNKPFIAVLSHYLVHTPLEGLPDKVDKYKNMKKDDQNNPIYAAMMESVDESVGKIMKTLEELHIADNTILVFTSDNGGYTPACTSNYPLMGGKSFPFEAGMKVPFIIRYPNLSKTHHESYVPIIGMDLFPTFMDAANIQIEQHADGISILPILQGKMIKARPLVFHFPHFTHATSPFSSILYEGWKLIRFYNDEAGTYLLYNIDNDPYEQNDLSEINKEKVVILQNMLSAELIRMKAEMPRKNPNYVKGAKGNQNRETSLKMAIYERLLFEKRIKKGL